MSGRGGQRSLYVMEIGQNIFFLLMILNVRWGGLNATLRRLALLERNLLLLAALEAENGSSVCLHIEPLITDSILCRV